MSAQTRIKICGLTNEHDARLAAELGADYLGFVLHPASPRHVTPERLRHLARLLPEGPLRVGVFVNVSAAQVVEIMAACALDIAQLHGDEPEHAAEAIGPQRVWKAVALRTLEDVKRASNYPARALLVDSMTRTQRGGTGQTGNWPLAARLSALCPVVLAGGLRPGNVAAGIRAVLPFAVDVSSGIEAVPGRKDPAALAAFVAAARGAAGVDPEEA